MEPINENTRISSLLKENPDAFEAIISISPKFSKLRNPLLRKLMAARTTINMACRIGGCTSTDFYNKLKPLGFEIDTSYKTIKQTKIKPIPEFMLNRTEANFKALDVRPILESENDPLTVIMDILSELPPEQILKIINSFEPIPLVTLLEKQGYKAYSEVIDKDLVITYLFKSDNVINIKPEIKTSLDQWEDLVAFFGENIEMLDVRQLEMPLPMLAILDQLESISDNTALYVYHKRIPVFLLPELQDRGFDYRIKQIKDGEVHLLIFKLK